MTYVCFMMLKLDETDETRNGRCMVTCGYLLLPA